MVLTSHCCREWILSNGLSWSLTVPRLHFSPLLIDFWDGIFFSYLVFIHNHKLNSAIQLDLKGNEENMEPKELQWEQRLQGTASRWGWGALLSYRRNGLVGKKSKELELSTVGNGDLLAGLAIPGPKTLHGFHNVHAFFHLSKDHVFAIQPVEEWSPSATSRRWHTEIKTATRQMHAHIQSALSQAWFPLREERKHWRNKCLSAGLCFFK